MALTLLLDTLISVIQTAAVLEVLHGAIGIVPSGFLSPLMQWSGRTNIILAIFGQNKEVCVVFPLMRISFTKSNTIFCWVSASPSPYWLTYFRYTGFIMIYPTVLVGELLIMYKALPHVKERNLYANLFSVFHFSYYDLLWDIFLVYPFLWLKLYFHLFKQRKSKLGKSEKHHDKIKRM